MSEAKHLLPVIVRPIGPSRMIVDIPGEQLFSIINSSFHDLQVKYCTWEGDSCGEPLTRITDFGRCITLNHNDSDAWVASHSGSDGGLRIIADILQKDYYYSKTIQLGMKVVLHEPTEEPFPGTRGFIMGPGKSAVVTIRRNEETSLQRPYVSLSGDYCVDTKSKEFQNPLQRYSTYSEDSCLKECAMNMREKTCGCRRFLDPGNATLCSVRQYTCHVGLKVKVDADNCSCVAPCSKTWYDYSVSYSDMSSDFMSNYIVSSGMAKDKDYIRNNIIDLRIYYDQLVVHRVRQVPEMTMENILGSLGGIMGLFLGASVISLVQLIEFLMLFLYSCCITKKKPAVTTEQCLKDETLH